MRLNRQENNMIRKMRTKIWNFLREIHEDISSTLDRSKTLFKGKGNTLIRNKNATCDNGRERDLNTHSKKKIKHYKV